MYWTLELASKLEDAPWPATKEELIDYATRSGAPLEVLENLPVCLLKSEKLPRKKSINVDIMPVIRKNNNARAVSTTDS